MKKTKVFMCVVCVKKKLYMYGVGKDEEALLTWRSKGKMKKLGFLIPFRWEFHMIPFLG